MANGSKRKVGAAGAVGGRAKTLRQLPAEVLVQRVELQRMRAGESLYDLSETLMWIHESGAWRNYAQTWDQFLKDRKLPGRSTAHKLFTIVKNHPRETLLQKGSEWCFGRVRFSTLSEQLRNVGIDPSLIFGELDPDNLNAAQLEAVNRRLREALQGPVEPTVQPPKPPPKPPKTKFARERQKALRSLGATRAIVSSFTREGVPWLRIQTPQSQWRFISSA
jgi:hypothetical protein